MATNSMWIMLPHRHDAVENPRLQRIKERMASFVFTTIWYKDWEDEVEIVQHIRSVIVDTPTTTYAHDRSQPHLNDLFLEK
jgi:hypothetical protein